jgi:hypothetical protein
VLQFALALILLVAGYLVGRYVRPAETQLPDPEIAQLRTELRDMREMVVLSLIQQQSASERLKGVSWSNQIEQPDSPVLTALLDTLMHDSNVNVRLACIDALRKFGEQQVVRRGLLTAFDRQESPLVQIALIDLVVELKETESVGALRKLADDVTVNDIVRQRARWGLEQLS